MWPMLICFSGMVLGIWISVSSAGWAGAWMGMEFNLLCFMPLVTGKKSEASVGMLYFFAQVLGSATIIFWGNFLMTHLLVTYMISFALLMKMGAAPYHMWYVWVSERVEWPQFFILSTIQKVIPMTLLYMHFNQVDNWDLFLSVILCALVGAIGGFQALTLRSLLAYSSVGHLGWILLALKEGSQFWVTYMLLYWWMLWIAVSSMKKFKVFHLSQLISLNLPLSFKVTLVVSMMSLGGFPPFIGFVPKLGVILIVNHVTSLTCLVVLIISSVISLYYYLRTSLTVLMVGSSGKFSMFVFEKKWLGQEVALSFLGITLSPLILI